VRLFRVLAALSTLFLVQACASMTSGTDQSVMVETGAVTGAACQLRNDRGVWQVAATPGAATVRRSATALLVSCTKPGHDPADETILSSGNATVLGNVLVGGLIGAAVDFSTGAAFAYPERVVLAMKLPDVPPAPPEAPSEAIPPEPTADPAEAAVAAAATPTAEAAAQTPVIAPPRASGEFDGRWRAVSRQGCVWEAEVQIDGDMLRGQALVSGEPVTLDAPLADGKHYRKYVSLPIVHRVVHTPGADLQGTFPHLASSPNGSQGCGAVFLDFERVS
jgi:hypothetical protein